MESAMCMSHCERRSHSFHDPSFKEKIADDEVVTSSPNLLNLMSDQLHKYCDLDRAETRTLYSFKTSKNRFDINNPRIQFPKLCCHGYCFDEVCMECHSTRWNALTTPNISSGSAGLWVSHQLDTIVQILSLVPSVSPPQCWLFATRHDPPNEKVSRYGLFERRQGKFMRRQVNFFFKSARSDAKRIYSVRDFYQSKLSQDEALGYL